MQTVTESTHLYFSFLDILLMFISALAMSVLRMIKLFGWERKIQAQVEEKREEELRLVWKRKILDLINNNLK